MVDKSLVSRQEAKIRELETRLEFERTQVKRLEVGRGLESESLAFADCWEVLGGKLLLGFPLPGQKTLIPKM